MATLTGDDGLGARTLEALGDAVIVTDLSGEITYWNAAAERLYGWSRDEVLGRSILEVTPTDASAEDAATLMETLARGGTWTGEFEVRRRDGARFPVLVTNTPLRADDGSLAGIIGVSVDITELQRTRAEAQARAAQQEVVADLGQLALEHGDLDAVLVAAAERVAAVLDAPFSEILELAPDGRTLRLRAGVGWRHGRVGTTELRADEPSQGGLTLREGAPVVVGDLATEDRVVASALLREHGVRSGVSTLIPGRSAPFGVLGVFSAEPGAFGPDHVAFLDAVAGLVGSAVARAETEAELHATIQELHDSEQVRVGFLRATSHELRTPLHAVGGIAETLQRLHGALAPETREQLLRRLVSNAERLGRLIEDILDVDRLVAGLGQAVRRPCALEEVVALALGDVELEGRRLAVDLHAVAADVDVPKIERVVRSLVANAVRHTPPDGAIHVCLARDARGAVLLVDNDGDHIPERYLSRVFEPFVQGPERRRDPRPGAGLGLTLARELVALHGGTITPVNLPEGGVRFEVVLPNPPGDATAGGRAGAEPE